MAAMAESEVIDMGVDEFGHKELNLGEHEMPGLIACRTLSVLQHHSKA